VGRPTDRDQSEMLTEEAAGEGGTGLRPMRIFLVPASPWLPDPAIIPP
jgi:hypothetical protein